MNRSQGVTSESPTDNTQPNAEYAAGASDQTAYGGEKESRAIPYDRFKEVNDERKQYQQRVMQLEAQNQQFMQNQQQMYEQQQRASQPQQPPKLDPNLERVKDILGRDEMGKKAYEAMEMLTEAKARQIAEDMRQNMMNDVNYTVNQRVNGVTSSMQTKQHIDSMVSSGRLSPADGQALQQQVAQAIQQYPQWEAQQPILVSTLLGNMYANGQIQPRGGMNSTPLQPGGGSPNDVGSSTLQRDAEILKKFPSLRNKPDKDLRAIAEATRKRQEALNV